jgi:short-subunit dehydrogenase
VGPALRGAAAALGALLPGRRAFITGGASGLGLALATELARAGWTVGLLDRDRAQLAAALEGLKAAGARAVHGQAVDVTDEAAFSAAVIAFADQTGGLELMVNNAGVAAAGALEATPAADWRWALDINVVGVAIGCRAALPFMKRANAGVLLNIASAAAYTCGPQMAVYNASKAAVVALSETLVQELHRTGIRVTVAMPGFFPTNLLNAARAPDQALAVARKLMASSRYSAARAASDLLAACARGEVYAVLPGPYRRLWQFKRFFPRQFMRWLATRASARAVSGTGSRPP